MNNNRLSEPPFFIIGAARSGTTLLQYMLRSHPELSMPTGESHFFIPFYKRRKEYGDLNKLENIHRLLSDIYKSKKQFFQEELHGVNFDTKEFSVKAHEEKRNTIPDLFSFIFEENAKGEGKLRWGDKTPYYALHCDMLLEMFPDARFIHLIRDGRDCALSMLNRKKDLKIHNIYHAAYTWNKYVLTANDFGKRHPECYFEIRYEDILDNPISSMEAICNFLGTPFHDSVINFEKSDGSGKTPLLTKPLQKSNKEKWKMHMSDHDLAVFESLAGETLKLYDYELYAKNPSIPTLSWLYYESHIKLSDFMVRLSRNIK